MQVMSLYVNVFCVYAAMSKSSKQLQNFIEIQYGCRHYTKFLHRNQWGKNKQHVDNSITSNLREFIVYL